MKRYLLIISAALLLLAGYVAHGQSFSRIGYAGVLITNVVGATQIGGGGGSLEFIRAATNTWESASSERTISSFDVSGGDYLIVAVNSYNLPQRTCTVTCNGSNVPLLTSTNWYESDRGLLSVFGLANPSSGNVVVTLSGNAQEGSVLALLFDGVGAIGAITTKAVYAVAYGITNSITTSTGDLVFDAVGWRSPTYSRTNLSGQTLIGVAHPNGSYASISSSTKTGESSSTTTGWSNEGGVDYMSLIQVVLQP